MTTSIEINESIRHFYGQALESNSNLKTSACCAIEVMGNKSRHIGLFDCSSGLQSESAKAVGACC
jgi:hypothetical protein